MSIFRRSWTLKNMIWLTLASSLCFYWFLPSKLPQEVEGPWNWLNNSSWVDLPARVDQIITGQGTLESNYPAPWRVPLSLNELKEMQKDSKRKQNEVELHLSVDFEKEQLVIIQRNECWIHENIEITSRLQGGIYFFASKPVIRLPCTKNRRGYLVPRNSYCFATSTQMLMLIDLLVPVSLLLLSLAAEPFRSWLTMLFLKSRQSKNKPLAPLGSGTRGGRTGGN